MQALVLTAINSPLVLETRTPPRPGADEVLVELQSAALNRRDFWVTQGKYPGIKPPVVLGSDGAGVVAACGGQVNESWVGREVIINPGFDWGDSPLAHGPDFSILGMPRDGTFASHICVPACQLAPKPDALDWSEAAALPLAGVTAFRALFTQGELKAGESVLITGIGGGVATFLLQFAVAAKANVWVTSSSPSKIARAVELGASGGFDYKQEDWGKQAVREAGPFPLIVDSAGGTQYSQLINAAQSGGRVVNYGATIGPPPSLDLFKMFWKQLRLVGSTMGSPEDFENMLQFVAEHGIRPIIDRVIPLADGNAAVESMRSSPQFGKIVLTTA